MAKRTSKKIKQVASRAKTSPRTEVQPTPFVAAAVQNPTTTVVEEKPVLANEADKNVLIVGGEIEFSTESMEQQRKTALDRSKKVELKDEIKHMIEAFKQEINTKLTRLTERIENQLKPMVQTVADVAVAKAEFELQFADFQDRLSATLNLNDELEPIEIAEMFNFPGSEMDEEMSTYDLGLKNADDEDMEFLTEATEVAHEKGWTDSLGEHGNKVN